MKTKKICCQKCDKILFIFDEKDTGKIYFGNMRCKSCTKSFRGRLRGMYQQFLTCRGCGGKILFHSDDEYYADFFSDDVKLFCSETCYKLFRLKE